jgi:hypothetical protein
MQYDNPFPGMNPYLERRDIWPDFHDGLIVQLRDILGPLLPDNYCRITTVSPCTGVLRFKSHSVLPWA